MRQTKLLRQTLQAAGLLDGIEVGTLQVLDETKDQLCIITGVDAHDCRNGVKPRQARGAPAALACDQLVAVKELAHEQWLQDALLADGFRELAQGLGIESTPDLL